tara:strand:+ start:167 stop:505 length:339 start_codon:yes stop_codon:yes gene_type:complete
MGKVRSVEHNAGITTRYIQESDGKLTINNQQNVNPLLKRNKELYNQDDGYLSKEREMKRVASIPPLVLQVWAHEYNGSRNWFALPKEIQRKIMRTKLNSSEFRYFRTASGNL